MTLGDFSKQAESYRNSRPSYPSPLIDLLIVDAAIKHGDTVADFGAGTGIFTRELVHRGFSVNAIEPNKEMRERAADSGANWIDGTFEQSQLPTSSQSWAVAAQAFHWADPPKALPEIHRILRPGCSLTVLWNDRVREASPIVNWTEQAIAKFVPEFDEAYRQRPWNDILESTGDFDFYKFRSYRHSIPMPRERYLELWRSHNRLNTIAGPDRFAAFFAELTNHLDQISSEVIEVHYECRSWSARRIE